ncbi:hypothetical protein BH20ACT15_BH20ACT15_03330 [soil metagenome]
MAEKPSVEKLPPRLTDEQSWEMNEQIAAQRIRDAAERPLGVNLAEGLAHSEFLLSFVGILRQR